LAIFHLCIEVIRIVIEVIRIVIEVIRIVIDSIQIVIDVIFLFCVLVEMFNVIGITKYYDFALLLSLVALLLLINVLQTEVNKQLSQSGFLALQIYLPSNNN